MKGVITNIERQGNGYIYNIKVRSPQIITPSILDNHGMIRGNIVDIEEEKIQRASEQQRKLYWTLVNALAEETGELNTDIHNLLRQTTMDVFGYEYLSFKSTKSDMEKCRNWIEITIQFAWRNGFYENPKIAEILTQQGGDDFMYFCIMNRLSCLTLQPGEIHHITTVGMGMDRTKICHVGMYVLPLTREQHEEAHRLGTKSFLEKYALQPMKLNETMVRHLNLGIIKNMED